MLQHNIINKNQCIQHWILEQPDGPTSMGECKYCATVKEFLNAEYFIINGNPDFDCDQNLSNLSSNPQ